MADFFDAALGVHANPNVRLSHHAISGALIDFASRDAEGTVTEAQFVTKVQSIFTEEGETLSAAGLTEISAMFAKVDAGNRATRIVSALLFEACFSLAEGGYKYQTVADFKTRFSL